MPVQLPISTQKIKNIVVIGVTGNSGPAIVQALVAANKFNIFALVRLESKATILAPVQVIKTDFSAESLSSIFTPNRFDAVLSLLNVLNPEGHKAEVNLINAASSSGVKRYIPSAFGGDNSDLNLLKHVPALGKKNDITNILRSLERKGLSWTAVACGPFFEWSLKVPFKFANIDFEERKFTIYDDGKAHHHSTTFPTIGKAIVNLLGDEEKYAATANRYIFIGSYALSQNQLFDAVEKVWNETGRLGTWTREYQSTHDAEEESREKIARGDVFLGGLDLIKIAAYAAEAMYWPEKLDNELLGLPVESLEADIKEILDELSPLK